MKLLTMFVLLIAIVAALGPNESVGASTEVMADPDYSTVSTVESTIIGAAAVTDETNTSASSNPTTIASNPDETTSVATSEATTVAEEPTTVATDETTSVSSATTPITVESTTAKPDEATSIATSEATTVTEPTTVATDEITSVSSATTTITVESTTANPDETTSVATSEATTVTEEPTTVATDETTSVSSATATITVESTTANPDETTSSATSETSSTTPGNTTTVSPSETTPNTDETTDATTNNTDASTATPDTTPVENGSTNPPSTEAPPANKLQCYACEGDDCDEKTVINCPDDGRTYDVEDINKSLAEKATEILLENYRSVARLDRADVKGYACYRVQITDNDDKTLKLGCIAIPYGQSACEAVRNKLNITTTAVSDECLACQTDLCNGSAIANLSVAVLLSVLLAKFLF